ncbi:MAG: hypothetical protein QOH83_2766 [Solirubrobacteraceae bacterium]|jgi:hypothetical protein|nr:hypothetical protein [Solirubrobacteraceae bacterium]
MRLRMPSPAMVVALIALVVSFSGTAFAVVNYARNAGAVDGKSAVSSSSSLRQASGNLVATAPAGRDRGRIPARFVADVMRGGSTSLTRYIRVVDNQDGPVVPLAIIPKIGRLDAQCRDQDPAPGIESTQTVISFTASERGGVNVSRLLGRDIESTRNAVVFTALKDRPVPILSLADNLFQLVLQARNRTVFVNGAGRSDANRSADAACLVFGLALRVSQ